MTKYTKADLIWEATRRNEVYKTDYLSMLEKYRNEFKINDCASIRYLPYVPSVRWNILILKEDSNKVRVYGWLDPSVDVDTIKRELKTGVSPFSIHPYAHIEKLNKTNPNIYYHHLDRRSELACFSEHKIDDKIHVCVNADFIGNKFLLLIDPLSEDKTIIKSVKDVKQKVLKRIKREADLLRKNQHIILYPRDIENYIVWLKKYDQIIDYLKKTKINDKLTIKNGAVIVPNGFRFVELVPNNTPADKFEGQRKAYKEAYEGAVKLIQSTPNLFFSPSRVSPPY